MGEMTNEEAITILNMVEAHGSLVVQAKDMAIKALEREPKTGRWIRQDNTKKPLYGWYFCSECNSVIGDKPKFCSNCGAKMESEDKG